MHMHCYTSVRTQQNVTCSIDISLHTARSPCSNTTIILKQMTLHHLESIQKSTFVLSIAVVNVHQHLAAVTTDKNLFRHLVPLHSVCICVGYPSLANAMFLRNRMTSQKASLSEERNISLLICFLDLFSYIELFVETK